MSRTELLQEIRKMRFEEAYAGWQGGHLRQEEAARLLGVCERTFRRYVDRYEEERVDGLIDKRLEQVSHRKAPVVEVMALVDRYRGATPGVEHQTLPRLVQERRWHAQLHLGQEPAARGWRGPEKAPDRGKHRKRREWTAWPGMLLHQDASTHEWVAGAKWDLVVTMDDATNEHYSMRFVEEEGTASSFFGVGDVIEKRGLFAALYTDRGSHYWHTPQAGGNVDKANLTQFARAMARLGIEMIPAYSPQARGRSERTFRTHQGRLPKELRGTGIGDMAEANGYLNEVYLAPFNDEFMQPLIAHAN